MCTCCVSLRREPRITPIKKELERVRKDETILTCDNVADALRGQCVQDVLV